MWRRIERIASDGAAKKCEMDPDLMGPPGFGLDFQKGKQPEGFKRAINGDSFAAMFGRHNSHTQPILRIAANSRFNHSRGRGRFTSSQGDVGLVSRAILELRL